MGVSYGRDHYNQLAHKEGYRARSVYKLKEIQAKYAILSKGISVVDLGAAPGSWSQYLAEAVGGRGKVYALDINPMDPGLPRQVEAVQADIFKVDPKDIRDRLGGPVQVVVSDMAPKTSGVRQGDHLRSIALCEQARDVATVLLKPGGHFVAKVFEGGEAQGFVKSLQPLFDKVRRIKPKSTKKDSVEFFVVAMGFKGIQEGKELDGPTPVKIKPGGYDPFADM